MLSHPGRIGRLGQPSPIAGATSNPFSPADITNLVAWWDPRDLSLTDGDPIDLLPDKVGSRDATASGVDRPTYRDGSFRGDGRPCMEFDGTNRLDFTELALSGSRTIFWTRAVNPSAITGTLLVVLGNSVSNSRYAGLNIEVNAIARGALATISIDTGKPFERNWSYDMGGLVGGVGTVRMNGRSVGTGGDPGDQQFSSIGARASSTPFFTGWLGEILIYDRDLTAGEIAQVEAYLQGWQIPCYVDATSGNDTANTGWEQAKPVQTVAQGLKEQHFYGGTVLFKRGEFWREAAGAMRFGGNDLRPLTVGAYSSGANPLHIGTVKETGPWVNTTGSEYTTAVATKPPAVYYWTTEGDVSTAIRLTENAGGEGSLSVNQWAYTGTTLTVNIGQDPTGEAIELSANLGEGFVVGSATGGNVTVANLDQAMHSDSNYRPNDNQLNLSNCESSFSENDNLASGGSGTILVTSNVTTRLAADEGFSAHGSSTYDISDVTFIDDAFHINSQDGTSGTISASSVEGAGPNPLFAWAGASSGGGGNMVLDGLTFRAKAGYSAAYMGQVPNNGQINTTTTVRNCTFIDESGGALTAVFELNQAGSTLVLDGGNTYPGGVTKVDNKAGTLVDND